MVSWSSLHFVPTGSLLNSGITVITSFASVWFGLAEKKRFAVVTTCPSRGLNYREPFRKTTGLRQTKNCRVLSQLGFPAAFNNKGQIIFSRNCHRWVSPAPFFRDAIRELSVEVNGCSHQTSRNDSGIVFARRTENIFECECHFRALPGPM
jgi:hypothetical protein